MSLKIIINRYRRIVTKGITKKIGGNSLQKLNKLNEPIKAKKILISRPNQRLGNNLLITPLLQELTNSFPEAKIDIFTKGKVAKIVFKNYSQVNNIYELPIKPFKNLIDYVKVWFKIRAQNYDLVINIEKNSSSGRLSTYLANSKYKLYCDEFEVDENNENHIHYGKAAIYQLRKLLQKTNNIIPEVSMPKLNLKLNSTERNEGFKKLNEIVQDHTKKTIAFYSFATGSKCYEKNWWENFYTKFYPIYKDEYNLIEILPIENISNLKNKLPVFYSKDIREIGSLINACEMLVIADCGIMHLSCAVQTKTIGLFKYDNNLKYKPYGQGNDVFVANENNFDELISKMNEHLKN